MHIKFSNIALGALAVLAVVLTVGCRRQQNVRGPFYKSPCEGWELDIYDDSLVTRTGEGGVLVTVTSSELKGDSTADTRSMPGWICGMPLLNAIYDRCVAERSLHDDHRELSPMAVYLSEAALRPAASCDYLRSLVDEEGWLTTGPAGGWPVYNRGRLLWVAAAWELYCRTSDKEWLAYAFEVADKALARDILETLDPVANLLHGSAARDTLARYKHPEWMNASDVYQSMSLGTNILAERATHILSMMARELNRNPEQYVLMNQRLRDAINDHLWIPNLGYYSQYMYGSYFTIQSQTADAEGNSLALCLGSASAGQRKLIFENLQRTPYGLTIQVPLAFNSPFLLAGLGTEAMWTLAASADHNSPAMLDALAAVIRTAALKCRVKDAELSADERAALVAVFLRGIAGISHTPHGLKIAPCVPKGLKGPIAVTGIRHGKSSYNIIISGAGTEIASIDIDGRKLSSDTIPQTTDGHHLIKISMRQEAGEDISALAAPVVTAPVWAPATPDVRVSDRTRRIRIINYSDSLSYAVFANGIRMDDITTGSYPLYRGKVYTELMLTPIASYRWTGYSPRPISYIPEGDSVTVQAEREVAPVSFVRSIRADHDSLVELSPQINTRLRLSADVAEEGDYIIDVRYVDSPLGGPAALRTLLVNGRRCGVIVMPRLDSGSDGNGFGFSNPLKATLRQGSNIISLDYIKPYNDNPDDPKNTVLVDYLRLIKL